MVITNKTVKGQEIINSTKQNCGFYLSDIYGRYSHAKEHAWQNCLEKFRNTKACHHFHICGYNSNAFSVAWEGLYVDETGKTTPAIFKETSHNSYIVLLED